MSVLPLQTSLPGPQGWLQSWLPRSLFGRLVLVLAGGLLLGALRQLPELAAAHAVQSPALLIVGEVAALANTLHWFGAAPITSISRALEAAA